MHRFSRPLIPSSLRNEVAFYGRVAYPYAKVAAQPRAEKKVERPKESGFVTNRGSAPPPGVVPKTSTTATKPLVPSTLGRVVSAVKNVGQQIGAGIKQSLGLGPQAHQPTKVKQSTTVEPPKKSPTSRSVADVKLQVKKKPEAEKKPLALKSPAASAPIKAHLPSGGSIAKANEIHRREQEAKNEEARRLANLRREAGAEKTQPDVPVPTTDENVNRQRELPRFNPQSLRPLMKQPVGKPVAKTGSEEKHEPVGQHPDIEEAFGRGKSLGNWRNNVLAKLKMETADPDPKVSAEAHQLMDAIQASSKKDIASHQDAIKKADAAIAATKRARMASGKQVVAVQTGRDIPLSRMPLAKVEKPAGIAATRPAPKAGPAMVEGATESRRGQPTVPGVGKIDTSDAWKGKTKPLATGPLFRPLPGDVAPAGKGIAGAKIQPTVKREETPGNRPLVAPASKREASAVPLGQPYEEDGKWYKAVTDPKTGKPTPVEVRAPRQPGTGDEPVPYDILSPAMAASVKKIEDAGGKAQVEFVRCAEGESEHHARGGKKCTPGVKITGAMPDGEKIDGGLIPVNNVEEEQAWKTHIAKQAEEKAADEAAKARMEQAEKTQKPLVVPELKKWLKGRKLDDPTLASNAPSESVKPTLANTTLGRGDRRVRAVGKLAVPAELKRPEVPREQQIEALKSKIDPALGKAEGFRAFDQFSFGSADQKRLATAAKSYEGYIKRHGDQALAPIIDNAMADLDAYKNAQTQDEKLAMLPVMAEHKYAMQELAKDYTPEVVERMVSADPATMTPKARKAAIYATEFLPTQNVHDLAAKMGFGGEDLSREEALMGIRGRILGLPAPEKLAAPLPKSGSSGIASTANALVSTVAKLVPEKHDEPMVKNFVLDRLGNLSDAAVWGIRKFYNSSRAAKSLVGAFVLAGLVSLNQYGTEAPARQAEAEYRQEQPLSERELAPGQTLREVRSSEWMPPKKAGELPTMVKTYRTVGLPDDEVGFAKKMIEDEASQHGLKPVRVEDDNESLPRGHHRFRVYYNSVADIAQQERARKAQPAAEQAKPAPKPPPAWFTERNPKVASR